MTARTLARCRAEGKDVNEMTARNIEKVTRFRPGGEDDLERMVKRLKDLKVGERDNATTDEKRWGGSV